MWKWLQELESNGVVRRKPGGFIWLHSPTRERLRGYLETPIASLFSIPDLPADVLAALTEWNAPCNAPLYHRALATWYRHVFLTSHSPAAVLEAIYHACEAARCDVISAVRHSNADCI